MRFEFFFVFTFLIAHFLLNIFLLNSDHGLPITTHCTQSAFWVFMLQRSISFQPRVNNPGDIVRTYLCSERASQNYKINRFCDKIFFALLSRSFRANSCGLSFSWGYEPQAIMNCTFSTKHKSHFVFSGILITDY